MSPIYTATPDAAWLSLLLSLRLCPKSSIVLPISIAILAVTFISLLLSLLGLDIGGGSHSYPLIFSTLTTIPMNPSSLCIYLSFLSLSSIPSGPQSRCWSPLPLCRQEGMGVGFFGQNLSRKSTACHQDHLVFMSSLQARVTL